jgi:hypothetical protein
MTATSFSCRKGCFKYWNARDFRPNSRKGRKSDGFRDGFNFNTLFNSPHRGPEINGMTRGAQAFSFSCAVWTAAILLAGCSNGLNEVTGKVTLDGQPVRGLQVQFVPNDPSMGTTAIGYTQADGTYKLHYPGSKTGAPPGEYTVRITGGEGGEPGQQRRVAPRYNSQSKLTATVKPGPNTFDFEVASQ